MSRIPSLYRAAAATKLAANVTTMLNGIVPILDDVAVQYLRNSANNGRRLMMVPDQVARFREVQDPDYERSPEQAAISRALRIMSKMGALHIPQAPETAASWELDRKRIGQAFDSNGPGFKNTMMPESTNVGTGNFPKVAIEGNATTSFMEAGVPRRISAPMVTGSLAPGDAASRAFDRLKAFMKVDNATMNTQGQDATMLSSEP